jgi:hypothetical protein
LFAATALLSGACSGHSEPAALVVSNADEAQDVCLPVKINTTVYVSQWEMQTLKGRPIKIEGMYLDPAAGSDSSSAIKVEGYYVQSRPSMGIVGALFDDLNQVINSLPAHGRKVFAADSGLRPAHNAIIRGGHDFRAAAVIHASGLGSQTWNGMDITYRDLGQSAFRTVLDPLNLQVHAVREFTPCNYSNPAKQA